GRDAPPCADGRRACAAGGHRLHHRPRAHRADRRRDRCGPRSDHPALPQSNADPLRDRQGSGGPAGSGDRDRARDRPRDVDSPAPRRGLTLDGKVVAQKVLDDVRAGVARLKDRTGTAPTLAVVLVGDFVPSKVYVANKKRAADTVGIASEDHIHPEGLDRAALLGLLRRLNADPKVHAILLQLPLPAGLDEDEAIAAIAPEKDGAWVIDVGINRLQTGKLVGDVEFESVAPRAHAITPVPGGVGPMTIAMLLRNTVRAAERQLGAA